MICQFCEVEYPAGTERCRECGSDLVAELPDLSSELVFEPLAELVRRRELELLARRLEEAGIPYSVQSGTAILMQESQALSETVRPSQWLARVVVISSRFQEAQSALSGVREDLQGEPDDGYEELEETPDRETQPVPDLWSDPSAKISPR